MKSRRSFLRQLLGGGVALTLLAQPAHADPKGMELANEFAHAYMDWGRMYERRTPGTLNLQELRAWKLVKEKWAVMRKYTDQEYSI